eukprot:2546887-Amphidinium_carterae.1
MGPSLRQAGFSKCRQEVVASRCLSWQEQGQGKCRLDLQWKEETGQGLSVQPLEGARILSLYRSRASRAESPPVTRAET